MVLAHRILQLIQQDQLQSLTLVILAHLEPPGQREAAEALDRLAIQGIQGVARLVLGTILPAAQGEMPEQQGMQEILAPGVHRE